MANLLEKCQIHSLNAIIHTTDINIRPMHVTCMMEDIYINVDTLKPPVASPNQPGKTSPHRNNDHNINRRWNDMFPHSVR